MSDPLYDDDHPALLASAVDEQLSLSHDARTLIMVPLRDDFTATSIGTLKEAMARQSSPLACIEQDEVSGQDDWSDASTGESQHIKYWWGMFRRRAGGEEGTSAVK